MMCILLTPMFFGLVFSTSCVYCYFIHQLFACV